MAITASAKAYLEVPEGLDATELTEWWAGALPQIEAVESLLWKYKRRLRDILRDGGPVQTKAGTLSLATDKFRWDEESLMQEFPALGTHNVTAGKLTHEEAERVLEVLYETGLDPEQISHSMKPDLRLVAKTIKTVAPEVAAKLLGLRTPDGKVQRS